VDALAAASVFASSAGSVKTQRRQGTPDRADDFFLKPDDIAQSVFSITQQPKSAWTFELDVRPFGEKW
jgi:NADP-dependent 3-hydroxy acid dehydrogenase YdfG